MGYLASILRFYVSIVSSESNSMIEDSLHVIYACIVLFQYSVYSWRLVIAVLLTCTYVYVFIQVWCTMVVAKSGL